MSYPAYAGPELVRNPDSRQAGVRKYEETPRGKKKKKIKKPIEQKNKQAKQNKEEKKTKKLRRPTYIQTKPTNTQGHKEHPLKEANNRQRPLTVPQMRWRDCYESTNRTRSWSGDWAVGTTRWSTLYR